VWGLIKKNILAAKVKIFFLLIRRDPNYIMAARIKIYKTASRCGFINPDAISILLLQAQGKKKKGRQVMVEKPPSKMRFL
jgi:hypothetical protein